jgi:4-oxalocrotonate tautomerase
MPIIRAQIWKGVDSVTRKEIASEITDLMIKHLNCPRQAITVIIDEIDKDHWFIGGQQSDLI